MGPTEQFAMLHPVCATIIILGWIGLVGLYFYLLTRD